MLKSLDTFYSRTEEPLRSTFMALSDIILSTDDKLISCLKYGLPFFTYEKKMFCYIWKDKKTNEPYIGIVAGNKINHPDLEQGNRMKMKILRIDSQEDLPVKKIEMILNLAMELYK